jgi:phosphatidylinositol-3-phosphatase
LHRNPFAASALALVLAAACGAAARAAELPHPAHVVVIIEENRSYGQVIGSPSAPYINELAKQGALFTDAHGITHPSLPNYFALFAGETNLNGDGCPATGLPKTANLASELIAAHRTFTGYSESLPEEGFSGCWAGTYARKHAPWVQFANVPKHDNLPLAALHGWDALPDVAYVIPNVDDDMHDGTLQEGDVWLHAHVASLVRWAAAHDTLLVLTWDEGFDPANHIVTLFLGPMVRAGSYGEHVTHYRVLRTIETLEGVQPTGKAAAVDPIADCWR